MIVRNSGGQSILKVCWKETIFDATEAKHNIWVPNTFWKFYFFLRRLIPQCYICLEINGVHVRRFNKWIWEGIILHVYITGDSQPLGDRSETQFQLLEQFLHRCKNLGAIFTRGYLSWKWLLEIVVHSRFLRLHFSKERVSSTVVSVSEQFLPFLDSLFTAESNRIEGEASFPLFYHPFFSFLPRPECFKRVPDSIGRCK